MAKAALDLRKESGQNSVSPKMLRRSITPMHVEAWRMLATPMGGAAVMIILAGAGFIFPVFIIPSAILGALILLFIGTRDAVQHPTLPIRLPAVDASGHLDINDPLPQHTGFFRARGEWFLGNTWSAKEVWAAFKDAVTHSLVVGGTGAGKTEQLMSMMYAGLSCGGGSGYVDPKAGPRLYGQQWTIARFLGRDDDVRVLNFALGQEALGKTPNIRSNTLQPFAFGKGEALKEIPLSLMAGGGSNEGSNSVFSSNGKTLISSLMLGLVDLRNKGEINLSINDIRDYIAPDRFVQLATRNDLSTVATEAMRSFLVSLGWKADIPDKSKWGDFDRQYSYAQNYFLGTLSMMSDVYRHIFNVPIGDIHMPDIILQRRIFVTMLPSMEKSTKELSDLGKITLAVIRLAVAVGLGGGEIMGNWKQLVELGPSASRLPFFLFVDEYAAIAIEGFSVVFTQGRSLNVAATLGTQDWDGMQKANKEEAQQIVANTKLKFFMTGDDPNGTKDLVEKLAGEEEEMRTQSFTNNLINYYDTQSAQAQKVHRVDYQDIKAQVEGEWHLFWKDRIIQGKGFFAGGVPDDVESPLFVHHFLMVERPNYTQLSTRYGDLRKLLNQWKKIALDPSSEMGIASAAEMRPEGYSPLADVFRAALFAEKNKSSQPGIVAPRTVTLGRRDIACAAIYAWIQDDPFRFDGATKEPDKTLNDTRTEEPEPEFDDDDTVPEKTGTVPKTLEDDDPFADTEPVTPIIHHKETTEPDKQPEIMPEIVSKEPEIPEPTARIPDKAETAAGDQARQVIAAARMNPFTQAMQSVIGPEESVRTDIQKTAEKVLRDESLSPAEISNTSDIVTKKVEELLTTPSYPTPPEPPKVTPDVFRKTASAWIDRLKTQK